MRMITTNHAMLFTTVFAVAACAADDKQVSVQGTTTPFTAAITQVASPTDALTAPAGANAQPNAGAGKGKGESGPLETDPNAVPSPADTLAEVPDCVVASDCPSASENCQVPVCNAGVCALEPSTAGSLVPLSAQVRGDCRSKVCGPAGTVLTMDDLEDSNDDNECTVDVCSNSAVAHSLVAAGTACSKGRCAEDGICHASGDTLWKSQLQLPGQSVQVDCITLDSLGSVVVTGRVFIPNYPYHQGFVAKVNAHGGQPWHTEFGASVSGIVYPAVGAADMIVAQFESHLATDLGQAVHVVALGSEGASLWQHATPADAAASPAGLAVDTAGFIQAAHTFQNGTCADFGGGLTCDNGAVSYDSAGNYVSFDSGAVVPMSCKPNVELSGGTVVSAAAAGNMLSISLHVQ